MVRIDPGKCTGCGECVGACPYAAPRVNSDEGVAKICDLCQGDPLCIKFCQPGALHLI
jgi:Fe-S-cluster-containing dehydrogenase component